MEQAREGSANEDHFFFFSDDSLLSTSHSWHLCLTCVHDCHSSFYNCLRSSS